jgi:hypothetical protein
MGNILKILGLLAGIVPIILTLIKEFETPGFGKEKKEAVLKAVGLFYDKIIGTTSIGISKDKLLDIAGGFIDIAVAFYNIVGWFKKKKENPT